MATATSDKPKTIATCADCGRTRKTGIALDGGPKTPPGWRRIDGELYCGATGRGKNRKPGCVGLRYYTRSIRVELTGPTDGETRTREEWYAALAAAAHEHAAYGNWLMQQLFAADTAASANIRALPKMPEVDPYNPARFPSMSPASIAALAKMVRQWYVARRFDAFVAKSRSVENYRFGWLPIEVRKQDWKITSYNVNKGVGVLKGLSIAPGKSWAAKFYVDVFQRERVAKIVSGDAIPLAAKIVRGTKRSFADAEPRKGWFLRISVMLPRKRRAKSSNGKLTLGHDPASLLFGVVDGSERDFEFHGAELKNLILGGDACDRKVQRDNSRLRGVMPRRRFRRWQKNRTAQCDRRQRKIDYQVRLAAAAVIKHCLERGVGDIEYDATDRGFVPHFPYRRLRDYIAQGAEAADISLVIRGVTEEKEST